MRVRSVIVQRQSMFLVLALGGCGLVRGESCTALSTTKTAALVDYVRKEYQIKSDTELRLSQTALFQDSCYRSLTFEGKGPLKTWQLVMYLSPDQRFLAEGLFDTTLDPFAERRQQEASLMADLALNKGASKGPATAPVTIVEFSDFQCPFCQRLAQLLKELPDKDRIRIVFHHMPLAMHSWARTAAEGAACAQLQSTEGFWYVHDQLFEHQQDTTVDNIKARLIAYATASKSIDMQTYRTCLDNDMSLGLVLRDINLAEANNINATPTLFVNGQRHQGVAGATELQGLVDDGSLATQQLEKHGSSGK